MYTDDVEIFKEAKTLAYRLADLIGETLNTFEAKRRPLAGCAWGLCYIEERRISIRFRAKARAVDGGEWWNCPDPRKQILETVAHEVAHLKHPNHSVEFKTLEKQLVEAI